MTAIFQWKQYNSFMQDFYHEDSKSEICAPIFAGVRLDGCHFRS